jgi:hypothetical protein
MIELRNEDLRVTLLDPGQDRHLLGPRFCWGGYVWQVDDAQAGPLLSGPEGAATAPAPFNGHGLPESFRDRTRDGQLLTWHEGVGLAPGVGIVQRDQSGQVAVTDPCHWTLERHPDRIIYHTAQTHGDRGYTLSRMIQLAGRDLLSVTRFSNTGRDALSLQWFAHPFFALNEEGGIDVQVPAGTRLEENPGFALNDRRLTLRRVFHGVEDGHFQPLQLPAGTPLEVRVAHPKLADIHFATSFVPSECPIWANGHTFSIEPYQTLHLEPVETRHWTLRYGFGPAR